MELNVDFDEKLEQLAKVPKPIRLAVVSAVLVAIAVGYWFLAYQPALSEKTVLTAKAQELQRELNNARAVAAKGPAFEAEIAGLERDLELEPLRRPAAVDRRRVVRVELDADSADREDRRAEERSGVEAHTHVARPG